MVKIDTNIKAREESPYIGENGNWWVWDDILGSYVDLGDPAQEMMVNHHT